MLSISKEMTVTSGDNSWFIKFHDISSGIRKCGALQTLSKSFYVKVITVQMRELFRDPLHISLY